MTDLVEAAIRQAAGLLRAGELVAIPTETVYGLAADASNAAAVARIFALKGRPADHPLIVHVADAGQLKQWARDIPVEKVDALARAFWPGPLTLILKKKAGVPDLVTGGQDTVGVRVPGHPLCLRLLSAFGGGVAAPSANRFGRISPTRPEHVIAEFGEHAPFILDGGACSVGIESTILDLSSGRARILRPGGVAAAHIEAVLGEVLDGSGRVEVPRVSGSLSAHYAPRTPLLMYPRESLEDAISKLRGARKRFALLSLAGTPRFPDSMLTLALGEEPRAYARELYASLRLADQSGADVIVIEAPPASTDWLAVMDRIGRAITGSGVADPEC